MKRIVSTLLVLLILCTTISFAHESDDGYVTMTMNNEEVSFRTVSLTIDNELITSDVPPVIYNERTLVPIRVVVENIGMEIEWNGETREVTIFDDSRRIVLTIGSETAIVDGIEKPLYDGVSAKLINSRTMVPIRFVAEELGFDVGWHEGTRTAALIRPVVVTIPEPVTTPEPVKTPKIDEDTNIVHSIEVNIVNDFPEVRIKADKELEFNEFLLVSPYRIVFDFQNTLFDLENKKLLEEDKTLSLNFEDGFLNAIRASQFEINPLTTRLVLEMSDTLDYRVEFDEDTKEMVVSFVNVVRSVKAGHKNTKEIIVIEGANVENYNVMRLSNPERLVVDIVGAYLHTGSEAFSFNVDGNIARQVRVAQFEPDHHYEPDDKIVRVVIDLQDKEEFEEFKFEVEDNQLIVHLEGEPFSYFNYEEVSWITSELSFRGRPGVRFEVDKDNKSNTINIIVPKSRMNMEFSNIAVDDHLIKNIVVDEEYDDKNYMIRVELNSQVSHRVISPSRGRNLVLELNTSTKQRGILIALDIGHGGRDPGAISRIKNMKESDIILDVGHRLNRLLLNAGFRTLMTRKDDTFVGLRERAEIANVANADLFISIHANSVINPLIHGVENLFYPSERNQGDNRNNRKLAEIFQRVMVDFLGAHDRGIFARPNLVVTRETKMPAIITEIGYLSNPAEEAKLATEEYRQKVAESLFKSILAYFQAMELN
ncbi:MAG: N-acetylmuramoyl-L-alanine amidase [Alkaliphilus sp.]